MHVYFSVIGGGVEGFFMWKGMGWVILFFSMLIGGFVSYVFSMLLGIPALKILEKINKVNSFSIVMGAGILSIIPFMLIIDLHALREKGISYVFMDSEMWFIFAYFFSSGVIVGIVFWLIVYSSYGKNLWKDVFRHRSLTVLSMFFGLILVPCLLSFSSIGENENQFLYLHALAITIAIIFMAFLMEEKHIKEQHAVQSCLILKYTEFRSKFTVLFAVVSVSLVWILGNSLFLIAYTWATESTSMKEEIYKTIILSGQILSGIGYFFGMFLFLVVQAFWLSCFVSSLYSLYIVAFKKDLKNIFYSRRLFAFWGVCSIMLIILIYIVPIAPFYINKSFTEEIDQRTQPLFTSIESFINDYNHPPDNLQELVPDYMDSDSLMVFEKYPYTYRAIDIDEEKIGALYVPVYCLEPFFAIGCKMVRLAGRYYSQPNMVEYLPHPDNGRAFHDKSVWSFKDSRPLSGFVMGYEIDAFANKSQHWFYHVWPGLYSVDVKKDVGLL